MSSPVLKLFSEKKNSYLKPLHWFLLILLLASVSSECLAEDTARARKLAKEKALAKSCSGVLYRSKKKDIPVYQESNATSKVLYRLGLGEKVCYIGEHNGFAILDWRSFLANKEISPASVGSDSARPALEGTALEKKGEEDLAYARVVDLWPPRSTGKKQSDNLPGLAGFFSKARSVFNRMGYGHPPEDALEPYRPVMEGLKQEKETPSSGSSCEVKDSCKDEPLEKK